MKYQFKDFWRLKKSEQKQHQVEILSDSMEPWIRSHDRIEIEICDTNMLKKNDIIVYWREERLICHLLVDYKNHFLFTRGLKEKNLDPPVHQSLFLGRIIKPRFNFFHKLLLKFI